jgi:flagellar hook-basal body complex protein FliE
MFPISNISPALPAQSIMPRPEIVSPETMPIPGADQAFPSARATEVSPGQQTGESFGSLLGRMIEDVNSRQNAAGEAVRAMQAGGNVSLHQAVIAMEEASVSFQLMVEVRNKLLDSYQELMRMQI